MKWPTSLKEKTPKVSKTQTPRLTRANLAQEAEKGCQQPGCTSDDCGKLMLSPGCHQGEPVYVVFDGTSGDLIVRCSVCGAEIVELVMGN